MKKFSFGRQWVLPGCVLTVLLTLFMFAILPISAYSADKLVVKDGVGNDVFNVTDIGSIRSVGTAFPVSKITRSVSHTTYGRGVAAFELESTGNMQDGFGPSFEFWISDNTHTAGKGIVTMVAARDGLDTSGMWQLFTAKNGALKVNLVVDRDGYVGMGMGYFLPNHPLELASGAYCSSGGVWTNASSREYKKDIKDLTTDEAVDTLKGLNPVKFNYKASSDEQHLGFIGEDVPELVATKDKKGMSSMDVVAVLTKVVQEQQKTIAELSKKMSELERKLKLKNDVAMLATDLSLPVVR
jgi:hypothetical protein